MREEIQRNLRESGDVRLTTHGLDPDHDLLDTPDQLDCDLDRRLDDCQNLPVVTLHHPS